MLVITDSNDVKLSRWENKYQKVHRNHSNHPCSAIPSPRCPSVSSVCNEFRHILVKMCVCLERTKQIDWQQVYLLLRLVTTGIHYSFTTAAGLYVRQNYKLFTATFQAERGSSVWCSEYRLWAECHFNHMIVTVLVMRVHKQLIISCWYSLKKSLLIQYDKPYSL